ncbi:hypothetical protein GCM10027184_13760 [Saccharothrix stipae]
MVQACSWRSDAVWASVAAELRGHLERGLGGLLTEDVVRFAAARTLIAAGVDATTLRVEAPHPALKGSRVDLVVGRPSPVALIELKFPREPNEVNAAWTMALGEVLKDFYRLAAYPGEVDRIFVYVEGDRLRRYMAGAARRFGVDLDTDTVALTPAAVAGLPATALGIIGPDLVRHHVTATRLAVIPVDDTLRLAIYHVDPLVPAQTADLLVGDPEAKRSLPSVEAARQAAGTVTDTDAPPTLPSAPAVRDGARREILDAVQAVLTRSGASTFTLAEVVAEMARRGTDYPESTIRTMVTSHLCRNAPDHAATTYDDLERVDRGRYRLVSD